MSSYIRNGNLMLKCDGCGETVEVYKDQTDRCLIHEYIHEHEWKTIKKEGKWLNICPDCRRAIKEQRRTKWINEFWKGEK